MIEVANNNTRLILIVSNLIEIVMIWVLNNFLIIKNFVKRIGGKKNIC